MKNDETTETSPDPQLMSEIHKKTGQEMLGHLYAANLLKHTDEPEQDIAATVLASPHNSDAKTVSPIKEAASGKLQDRLNKLLEDLGSNATPTDEKGLQKLVGKAQMHLMKTPGFSKMRSADKDRLTHRLLKLASQGHTEGLYEILEHELEYSRNRDKINAKIAGLFSDAYQKEDDSGADEHDKIKQYADNHEHMDQLNGETAFAEGGEVKSPIMPNRVASAFPQQAVVLGGAKARMANYLNSVKPQKSPGLPFDKKHESPSKNRHYHEAVKAAARPLAILDRVKDGSITPNALGHFASMHPELHDLLKKKITHEITKKQLDESSHPPFHVKQALSLFMGSPMDQSLTPATIQAAQATYAPQQGPQQPSQKPKGSPSKLKDKSVKAYETPDQAAQMDRTAGRTD